MISGKSKLCGILAYPVEHSLSPCMHQYYAEKTGMDQVYVPLKARPEYLEAAVKGAYALHFAGMNVTVPHKQAVMEYLLDIDQDARAIGAVNTLVRMENGFKGYNTDAPGFLKAMECNSIKIKGRDCILIGAGGAAKAAAYVLAKEGARFVYLLNRSVSRAEELASYINRLFGKDIVMPMDLNDYSQLPQGPFLAVQTTSVGMHPNEDSAPVEDMDFYRRIEVAMDVIYNPEETKFMRLVKAAGGRAVNGLDMLIYQGIIAYQLWNPEAYFTPQIIDGARELMKKQLEEDR